MCYRGCWQPCPPTQSHKVMYEVHLISLGTDADRDENNELVEAVKFYKNLNFTAAAK